MTLVDSPERGDETRSEPIGVAGGRRGLDRQRRLTLMSVDLVGSTPLAERLDPEHLRDVLLSYHDICDQAVRRYDGRIGARPGDGMMVHFGLTNPHEDDARRATLAGLAIIEALEPLARRLQAVADEPLQVRIGVHTGSVVITELGGRAEIIGTTPNETARLESQALPGTVAVSDATHELIADDFEFDEPREVTLRGVTTPMKLYTVRGPSARAARARAVIPFVGRRDARQRLAGVWARVCDDDPTGPRAACIIGAPGYGKSRLADLIANTAIRDGATRLVLQARAYDAAVPYGPVISALTEAYGLAGASSVDERYALLEAGLAAIGAGDVAPILSQVLDLGSQHLGEASAIEPSLLQPAIEGAVIGWLRALSASQRVVLLVEDLQWADPSTAAVVARVVREAMPGLLLLITSRTALAPLWAPEQVESIELGALSDDDVGRLVGMLDHRATLTEEQVARIVDASDGVPLYLDRLIELTRHDDTEALGRIPNGVDQLLTTLLETPDADHQFIGLLASIDRQVSAEFVADVYGIGLPDAIERLEALTERGILDRVADSDVAAYMFHHTMLQAAAYAHQLPSDRRAAHARIADSIERRGMTSAIDVATMARHLDEAGRHLEAVPLLHAASVSAHRKGASAEATRLLDRGIELLGELPPGRERDALEIDLQLHRSVCLTASEGFGSQGALEAARRAYALTSDWFDPRTHERAVTALFSFHTVRGEGTAVAEIIRAERSRSGSTDYDRASCDQLEALHLIGLGRLREAHDLYVASLSVIEEHERAVGGDLGDDSVLDRLTAGYAQMVPLLWQFGDTESSRDWYGRALKRAQSFDGAKGAFSEAYARTQECFLKNQSGDHAGALESSQALREFCARKGLAMWAGYASLHETVAAANLAPTAQVADMLGLMTDVLRGMGVAAMVPYSIAQKALVLHRLARHSTAVDELTTAIELARKNFDLPEISEFHRHRAHARLALGDDDDADADFAAAATVAIGQGATIYAVRALSDLLLHGASGTLTSGPLDATATLRSLVESVATPDAYAEVVAARELLDRPAPGPR